MKKIYMALVICIFLGSACEQDKHDIDYPVYTKDAPEGYAGYSLVWSEDFDTDGLPNASHWDYEEGYLRNGEFQDYKKADLNYSRIEDGKLIIEAKKDPHEGIDYYFDYSSASLVSKKTFGYGRLDIAAKIPTGRGVWPGFRLKPVSGEDIDTAIELMEYVFGSDKNHQTVWATIHTPATENAGRIISGTISSATLEDRFHLYSLVLGKEKIEILFDNVVVLTYEKTKDNDYASWPFGQSFYLEMNIAVGGNWGGTWGVDKKIFPKQMEIESIRYYQQVGDNEDV